MAHFSESCQEKPSLKKLAHAIYRDTFPAIKNKISLEKKYDIFNVFAANIDCGYRLEPPLRGSHVSELR